MKGVEILINFHIVLKIIKWKELGQVTLIKEVEIFKVVSRIKIPNFRKGILRVRSLGCRV